MSLWLALKNDGPPLDFRTEIPEGKITALVGPSGSGKTSILRAIAGLFRLDQADIRLGSDVWDGAGTHLATRERSIGLVPQHYGLFPHLTVARQRQSRLEPSGAGRAASACHSAMDQLPAHCESLWQTGQECVKLIFVSGVPRRGEG